MDDLADIGPIPPPWMPPDAKPVWKSPTSDGTALLWLHGVGDDVTITCEDTIEDGEWYRSSAEIGIIEHVYGMDAEGARRLAADLNAAADLIDE